MFFMRLNLFHNKLTLNTVLINSMFTINQRKVPKVHEVEKYLQKKYNL